MAAPLALVLLGEHPEEEETTTTTISAIGYQWDVQYARFFNYPNPPLSSTHPSLTPIRASFRNRVKGNWISSSSSAFLTLAADDSAESRFILSVAFLGRIYEEHYISKLHFSWPQVSCVAGFPTRGTRAVFVSYRDSLDQIQKFALRFSTNCATETFINALKKIMGGSRDARHPCSNYVSGISSQSEFVPSDESPYRPKQDWISMEAYNDKMQSSLDDEVAQSTNSQDTELNRGIERISGTSALRPSFTSLSMSYSDADQSDGKFLSEISSQPECVVSDESPYRPKLDWISADTSPDQMQSSLNLEVDQNSCSADDVLKRDTVSIFGSLPPSFTSLVMSCLPAAEQDGALEPVSGDIDLKNQIARCLEDSSFQDMLIKVEKVISEIGDGLLP